MSTIWFAPVIGWLVLAYLEPANRFLPKFSYQPLAAIRWLPGLLLILFLVFCILQIWVALSTFLATRHASATEAIGVGWQLHAGWELFWSVIPIALTLAVGWMSIATLR